MRAMFGFGKDKKDETDRAVQRAKNPGEGGAVDAMATGLVERLLATGFDGKLAFDSAHEVAQAALDKHGGNRDKAIDEVIADHRKLAATSGFVTGLGGLFTMPVALPANVIGFYLLATRMVAAVAELRGHDINRRELRSAVLLTLVGTEADDVLAKAGVATTGRLAGMASQKLPPALLMVVNKAVGFRLIGQVGAKAFARVGKAIPVAGGVIGAGLDLLLLNKIAANAREQFPAAGA